VQRDPLFCSAERVAAERGEYVRETARSPLGGPTRGALVGAAA
jgi:hypothetical protein